LRLIDLIEGDTEKVREGAAAVHRDITGITSDSRRVEPGFLFAALPGSRADGRAYIAEAVRRGAAAVLAPPDTTLGGLAAVIPLITDDNPRRLYALMAARLHAGQPATVVAVTGTNGKTSVVSFARQIWTALGRRAASYGTLGIQTAQGFEGGSLTTPDPVDLHTSLRRLAAQGVECLAMEASSHGLEQHRLDGVRLSAAAFTNLSRDHLDYHGSMAAYFEAKLRLFRDLLPADGTAVINADDAHGASVIAACRARGQRVIAYGKAGTELRLLGSEPTGNGQRLAIEVFGRRHTVDLPLIGGFQADNALCALGLVLAGGADAVAAVDSLAHVQGAPGRLQLVARHAAGAPIFVDYAHTPDALANVLDTLRPHVAGRLFVVFGCGGDRDAGKRPEMGRIAAERADVIIVTDDNPRSEQAAAIRGQILAACPGAREVGDRAAAIRLAVSELAVGDLLVVAGKGHERGQIVGTVTHPFDDAEQVRAAVAASAAPVAP